MKFHSSVGELIISNLHKKLRERYENSLQNAFDVNEIEFGDLPNISAETLHFWGVESRAHQIIIMDEIKGLIVTFPIRAS